MKGNLWKVSDLLDETDIRFAQKQFFDLRSGYEYYGFTEKGKGYERWAKIYNVKQVSKALLFLQEHGLRDYSDLDKKAIESAARFHELSDSIKAKEARLAEIAVLKTHIINYSKTKEVYVAYRKSGYS